LLQEIATHLGADRRVVIARELTKRFEEVLRGTASSLDADLQHRSIKGECTVLIAGHSVS
jgi:16S rRNA (cytidine1402-2'-O)-methyltransferase